MIDKDGGKGKRGGREKCKENRRRKLNWERYKMKDCAEEKEEREKR